MGLNFIILQPFLFLGKGCIDTYRYKKSRRSGDSFCVCVRREKKHASGWEDPLLIVTILPIFFEIMFSV